MKKIINKHKKYKALSRTEAALLNAIEPLLVFSPATLKKLTGWKKSTLHNTLVSLKKKGVLTAVKKGSYTLTENIPENLFAIAALACHPSYLSFWTAASYYGWTEQQVSAVQVVSTKQFPLFRLGSHTIEIITTTPEKFFGYQRIHNFPIAEKEKLIVEMLSKPELCGGVEEVRKCLARAWPEINQNLLYEYLLRFKNKSCCARLGYFLEKLQLKHSLKKKLLRCAPKGYILLNPRKEKTKKYHHQWRVIINDG